MTKNKFNIQKLLHKIEHMAEKLKVGICLAQTGFAAIGKGMQFVSGSPYAKTELPSRLTSSSCKPDTS